MNKCEDDDEPDDIVHFYTYARELANAFKLPDLDNPQQMLMVSRKSGIKRKMSEDALRQA